MKVKDSQLKRIRQLYKNMTQGKKVDDNFDTKVAGTNGTAQGAGSIGSMPETGMQTNFGDLHQAVERRKYEFAARAVANTPDIRADKVADIEARIQAGTYKVDAESVAEAMINAGLFDDI